MKRKQAKTKPKSQRLSIPFADQPDVFISMPGGTSVEAGAEILRKLGLTLGVRYRNAPRERQEFWAEDDRFYHAADSTWWRWDQKSQRLVRADAPKIAQ